MSSRPLNVKRANRVRKALRSDLPRWIYLIDYLKSYGHAQTTGEAEKIILAERVRAESHKLGIKRGKVLKPSAALALSVGRAPKDDDFEEKDVVDRLVPAAIRDRITVLPA